MLENAIAPHSATLRFDIEYRLRRVRRLFCHVHHPSSGFFATQDVRKSTALQIDAGMNFSLWLVGWPYDTDAFARHYVFAAPRAKKAAPLPEMWAYVQREKEEGRILTQDDYSPSFLSWARRFLGNANPGLVLGTGESLAGAIASEIRRRLRLGALERHHSSKENAPLVDELEIVPPLDETLSHIERKSFADERSMDDDDLAPSRMANFKTRNSNTQPLHTLHNSPVTVLGSGTIKLQNHGTCGLTFRLGCETAKKILNLGKTPQIQLSANVISISVDEMIVYQKPIDRLLASPDGPAWFSQIMHEMNIKNEIYAGAANAPKRWIRGIENVAHNPAPGSHWKNGEL